MVRRLRDDELTPKQKADKAKGKNPFLSAIKKLKDSKAKGGESKAQVKKEIAFMKKKGAPKSMIEHEKKEAKGMAGGGMTSRTSRPPVVNPRQVRNQAHAAQNQKREELRAQSAAATKAQSVPASSLKGVKPKNPNLTIIKKKPKFAKGGSVSSRADGVAKKGRTKCRMV